MRILEKLAQASAILAGLLMTFITVMTCVSLIGRNTTGTTLAGDFELTGVAAGAAIALFMPWCQLRRGNIIVDFFTAKVSDRINAMLDRFGALLLGLVVPADGLAEEGRLQPVPGDDGVLRYLEERLAKYRYVGIGEFHLYGEDADLLRLRLDLASQLYPQISGHKSRFAIRFMPLDSEHGIVPERFDFELACC